MNIGYFPCYGAGLGNTRGPFAYEVPAEILLPRLRQSLGYGRRTDSWHLRGRDLIKTLNIKTLNKTPSSPSP